MTTTQKTISGVAAAALLGAVALLRTDLQSPNSELPPTFIDPPEINLELLPTGHHYRFQQAASVSGPWQTVFERQNEFIEPLRFSVYRTSVCMFYRVEEAR